jgi:bifunctional DNA-binding transcriptional regulator/antitoxin component of YhaV-PrlF toxin-antitoxin module
LSATIPKKVGAGIGLNAGNNLEYIVVTEDLEGRQKCQTPLASRLVEWILTIRLVAAA